VARCRANFFLFVLVFLGVCLKSNRTLLEVTPDSVGSPVYKPMMANHHSPAIAFEICLQPRKSSIQPMMASITCNSRWCPPSKRFCISLPEPEESDRGLSPSRGNGQTDPPAYGSTQHVKKESPSSIANRKQHGSGQQKMACIRTQKPK
jgi:hypothetical protein